jgi:D-lactate dehydrogenase
MKFFFYSTGEYEIPFLKEAAKQHDNVIYSSYPLGMDTCIPAHGCEIISIFTEDDASAQVPEQLYGLIPI